MRCGRRLDVGDAAMHRAYLPDERDLNACLDIAEGTIRAMRRQAACANYLRLTSKKSPAFTRVYLWHPIVCLLWWV